MHSPGTSEMFGCGAAHQNEGIKYRLALPFFFFLNVVGYNLNSSLHPVSLRDIICLEGSFHHFSEQNPSYPLLKKFLLGRTPSPLLN